MYYVVQAEDETIRAESTLVGAFTPRAKYVLDMKRVVFGTVFKGDNKGIIRIVLNTNECKEIFDEERIRMKHGRHCLW